MDMLSIAIFAIPLLLAFGSSLAGGIVMIVGGLKMLRLESHGWAMAACLFALLPINPLGIIGVPETAASHPLGVGGRAWPR
jgi:hypothetical protein